MKNEENFYRSGSLVKGSPDLTVAADDVLVAAQLAEAHGAAGVELLGGDAHLAAQPELSPSVKRVEQFTYTAALSTAAVNRSAWACVRVRMASLWPVE